MKALDPLRHLATATAFYTRLPIPLAWQAPPDARLTAPLLPMIGLAVGALTALMLTISGRAWPQDIAVGIAMMFGWWLTGGFHEDGLADTADGLCGTMPGERERALTIMKDSRIGTFGVLALVGVIGLKFVALRGFQLESAAKALLLGHSASRALAVAMMGSLDYVRPGGRAQIAVSRLSPWTIAVAQATGWAPLFLWPHAAVRVVGASLATWWLLRRSFKARIGGYTGDCLGATQQLCECAIYLALLANV